MILSLQIIYTITDPLAFSCYRSFILSLWSSCILLLQIIYAITMILLCFLVTDHLYCHYGPLAFSCYRSFILSLWSSCILLLQIIYTVTMVLLHSLVSDHLYCCCNPFGTDHFCYCCDPCAFSCYRSVYKQGQRYRSQTLLSLWVEIGRRVRSIEQEHLFSKVKRGQVWSRCGWVTIMCLALHQAHKSLLESSLCTDSSKVLWMSI